MLVPTKVVSTSLPSTRVVRLGGTMITQNEHVEVMGLPIKVGSNMVDVLQPVWHRSFLEARTA